MKEIGYNISDNRVGIRKFTYLTLYEYMLYSYQIKMVSHYH